MSNKQQKPTNQKQITITQEECYTLSECLFILLENDFELNLSKDFTQAIRDLSSKIE